MKKFDAVIIGAGQAGPALAGRYAAPLRVTMKRRLSSITTHFYKGIPLLLLSIGLYWLTSDFRGVKLEGMVFLFLISAIWHLLTFRWKSVYLRGDVLSVSTFLRGAEIPLANVESISASSWLGVAAARRHREAQIPFGGRGAHRLRPPRRRHECRQDRERTAGLNQRPQLNTDVA